MKELLYLKDTQLKELIEKLFTSYRESFSDARKTLNKYSIGIAHHKVLHLLSMYEGITISELLKKLKITKQSLHRVYNSGCVSAVGWIWQRLTLSLNSILFILSPLLQPQDQLRSCPH